MTHGTGQKRNDQLQKVPLCEKDPDPTVLQQGEDLTPEDLQHGEDQTPEVLEEEGSLDQEVQDQETAETTRKDTIQDPDPDPDLENLLLILMVIAFTSQILMSMQQREILRKCS